MQLLSVQDWIPELCLPEKSTVLGSSAGKHGGAAWNRALVVLKM